jgi:hypothetical protein
VSRVGRSADADGSVSTAARTVVAVLPVAPRTVAGLLAALPVAAATLYRLAHNAPGALPEGVPAAATALFPVAVLGPALAALSLAAVANTPAERVGFAVGGGFGVVAAFSTTWLPVAAAIACGGGLVVGSRLWHHGRADRWPTARRSVAVVPLAGVVVSLAAAAGVAPQTLRPLGSVLALAGVAAVPLLVRAGRPALLAGTLAGLLTALAATGAPYVTGAVLLVAGGVVGAPLVAVLLGVGGGVAGVVGALRRGRVDLALGAGLLLVAGVPGTLFRALGIVVALGLLVEETDGPGTVDRQARGGDPA